MIQYDLQIEKFISLRHELHKIPEMAYQEFKTKKLLYSCFKSITGFKEYAKVVEIGTTGFYVDIWGTKSTSKISTNLISLRCDMDALPLEDKTGTPYKSTHENRSHACGHDGHMAILTCTMAYFLSNIHNIDSNFGVRFLYQPAEEGELGAVEMIKGGCLENIKGMYGLHNTTTFPLGTIGCKAGPIMGRMDTFEIEITGKGGHGSAPDLSKNPILPGSFLVSSISGIPAQDMPSSERCVISVCKFQSGHTFNVIPDTAQIAGSIRSLKNEHGEKMVSRIKELSDGISKVYGCSCKTVVKNGGLVLENDVKETELISGMIEKHFVLSDKNLPVMAGEDFSYFCDKVPCVFVLLGTKDEYHQSYLHTSNYDFNDKALNIGVEFFIRLIELKLIY